MRLYLRRVLTWALFTCTVLLTLNIYHIQQWRPQQSLEDTPWGTDFHDFSGSLDAHAAGGGRDGADKGNAMRRARKGAFVETNNKFHNHSKETTPVNQPLKFVNRIRSDWDTAIGENILINHDDYTVHSDPAKVWPTGRTDTRDRVVAQLVYVPPLAKENKKKNKLKTILVYNGLGGTAAGRKRLIEDKCLVDTCFLTDDGNEAKTADAILFQGSISRLPHKRPPNQVWVLFFLESPKHTQSLEHVRDQVNWTATYRRDSTIVAPYERFTPFTNITEVPKHPSRNYAKGKTKKVAWFVSNCGAANGRQQFAEELGKHIQVDIFGSCGKQRCPRHSDQCFEMLKKDYKFYLAFENSNCVDYMTEKLFWNAYWNDVVPIVLGARPEDYFRSTPPRSYIHVDDFASPKKLAEYLHKVDKNDDLYNEYFRWKGTGSFINTKFWCRMCAMLHDTSRVTWYSDIQDWWHGTSCINRGHWNHTKHSTRTHT